MAQRSVILHKKLTELESELADVFRIPLDPLIPGPRHRISFEDVVKRIEFLKNLLSLEAVTSQPQDSDQLHDIAEKIAVLEAAFHEWDESRTSALSNFDVDTLSICSDCTQAILNDGSETSVSAPEELDCTHAILNDGSETPVSAPEELDGGEKWPEKADRPEAMDTGEEARRIWGKFGNYCGFFGSGVIVGAICMVKLSSILSMVDTEAFLLPPT